MISSSWQTARQCPSTEKETAMTSKRTILRKFAAIPAAVFMILPVINAAGAEERLDWWAIDNEVGDRLITGEKNLVEWAGELAASEPESSRDAVVKLDVCLRAALDEDACEAVRALWRLGPEKADSYLLTSSYYAATDHYQAWDVARAIVETFAPRIHEISLENRLIKHFRAEDNPQRWSDDALVAWLDARVESVRRYDAEHKAEEFGKESAMFRWRVRPIQYWTRLRLRYLAEMGRAGAELERMAAQVRSHPTDAEIAAEYLSSLMELGGNGGKAGPVRLDWMPDVCRPARAIDLQHIASLLVDLEQYKVAEKFYLRAMETEITDAEISQLSMMCQAVLPGRTHRLLFEVGIREELAKCLLKLGETGRSQQIMVEAADMRKKHNLPANPYLAGTVQAASGERIIEGRIREEEETNKDDPQYWLKRADYYRGRSDTAGEEEALRHGLALCPPAPQSKGKASMQIRARILHNLTHLLIRDKRPEVAVGLLLAELNEAPVDAASSESAARLLGFDLPKYINVNEPILWNWLARRNKWEHTEERLLMRMLEAAPPDARRGHFIRAENLAMADDADPTRAATLGWIFNRMGAAESSIPLLEHAVKTAADDDLKQRAALTLFESYLDLKNWRAAESIVRLGRKAARPARRSGVARARRPDRCGEGRVQGCHAHLSEGGELQPAPAPVGRRSLETRTQGRSPPLLFRSPCETAHGQARRASRIACTRSPLRRLANSVSRASSRRKSPSILK